jgi:hypothetical protein
MKKIEVISEINAPIEKVWAVLTDFPRYKEWNTFIPLIEGQPIRDSKLKIQITPPGKKAMTFTPVITQLQKERLLQWCGVLGMAGLFKGIHSFELERLSDTRTRLIHYEVFTGILVPFVFGSIGEATRQGFRMMNEAINQQAEDLYEKA